MAANLKKLYVTNFIIIIYIEGYNFSIYFKSIILTIYNNIITIIIIIIMKKWMTFSEIDNIC